MNASIRERPASAHFRQPEFAEMLKTPPAGALSMSHLLNAALRTGRASNDGFEPGFDVDSFAWRDFSMVGRGEMTYVKLALGVWLVYGDMQLDASLCTWYREDRAMYFSVMLRGAAMLGASQVPHSRVVYTQGCMVATAFSGDTLICRHVLPGVRNQTVSVFFESDDAMRDFGLDPAAARRWFGSTEASGSRAERAFRVAVSTPNLQTIRAAHAILWNSFDDSRRRLYLRSKAGELMCHLLGSPVLAPSGAASVEGGARQDSDSLAALAHAAMSDPEDCPSIADLAERMQVSTGRLISVFKSKYGKTPRDHALCVRMERARRLLQQTRTPVIDIALSSGYEHHSSFSTAYKRVYGESPLDTRRCGDAS